MCLDIDRLQQQIDTERANHQQEVTDLQNQIAELRAETDRLKRLSSNGSHRLRIKMSETLNLMNGLSDNEVDNLTFGTFEDFWNKVDDGNITSSETSETDSNSLSSESLETDGSEKYGAFLSSIFARTKRLLKIS